SALANPTKGTMAPKIIPKRRIQEGAPWLSFTDIRAREKMTDHITEAKNTTKGKAYKAICAGPKRAAVKQTMAAPANIFNTNLLSMILSKISPRIQPRVKSPQNREMEAVPLIRGSKP